MGSEMCIRDSVCKYCYQAIFRVIPSPSLDVTLTQIRPVVRVIGRTSYSARPAEPVKSESVSIRKALAAKTYAAAAKGTTANSLTTL